jgi:hypothetical protein
MTTYKIFVESIKTLKCKFALQVFLLGSILLSSTALKTDITVAQQRYTPAFSIKINPQQAFINGEANPVDGKPIDLSLLGINPGDKISIERFGYFSPYSDPNNEYYGGVYATFSTDNILLSNNNSFSGINTVRVPGAIDTLLPNGCIQCVDNKIFFISYGQNQVNGGYNGILVEVPANARYLFIGVNDSYFGDNVDSNGDFAVGITKVLTP